ncbi:MAG TPA: hypothetical protein VHL58_01385 [Thermoanaerobaculia bacterium]|nr:hypothetical protein [Thermoanaerobaculia bacterium]
MPHKNHLATNLSSRYRMAVQTLEARDCGEYVEFVYSGPFELTALVELARAVNEHCTAHQRSGALIDISRSIGELSNDDRLEHGKTLAVFWNPKVCAAVFGTMEQARHSRFWQLVVQNRGVRARSFSDRLRAVNWLTAALRDHTEGLIE